MDVQLAIEAKFNESGILVGRSFLFVMYQQISINVDVPNSLVCFLVFFCLGFHAS